MSSLLRSPAIRRAFSAAASGGQQGAPFLRAPLPAAPAVGGEGGATVRRGLGLPTVPRRRLSEHTTPSPEQVDQVLKQVHELEEIIQQDVGAYLKHHKEIRTGDHGYFEGFLSKNGMPKSPFRDLVVWRCKLATICVASGMAGYLVYE